MSYRLNTFKKVSFCRHFENQVYKNVQNKNIKLPVYLSAGQEYIPASIATVLEELNKVCSKSHDYSNFVLTKSIK